MKRSFSVMNEEYINKNEMMNIVTNEVNSISVNIIEEKEKEEVMSDAQENFTSKKIMSRNKDAIRTYCRIRAVENDPGKII